jgi:Arc/MetJ family transcription regulator
VQAFIKTVNYNHMMPTRYVLDLDLKATVTADCTETTTKRVAAGKAAKALLEERYKTGKNRCARRASHRGELGALTLARIRWFFSRLKF